MIFRPHHLALAIALGTATASAADLAPLQAVESVNLTRYLGRWYQMAHYPNKFQAQCVSDTIACCPKGALRWSTSARLRLAPQDRVAIDSLLQQQGFDLARLQEDPHTAKP